MKTVVKRKNLDAFRIWFTKLGYQVSNLKEKGFTARTSDRGIKKKHHYVLVTDTLNGNPAAFELGKEFEDHLASPDFLEVKGDKNGVLSFVA
ncbi:MULTISPECIES: response regulator [unclassified Acinetobacter]|uniref:response regulator n=1 Tax=unclassified Acinetobacter TaxID=196816 RepID=UPI001023806A|nr:MULTISPECIES: response regulator [unclassified Acinetobacter]RZG71842.1 response regulator [Acinetobacter sp. WCHAc060025]RZG76833.1 response regulator [Acinetobacter sp. WCHAc060033]